VNFLYNIVLKCCFLFIFVVFDLGNAYGSSGTENESNEDVLPKAIFIIRHAEKISVPWGKAYQGLDPDYADCLDLTLPLSAKGWTRAFALSAKFNQLLRNESGLNDQQREALKIISNNYTANTGDCLKNPFEVDDLFLTPDVLIAAGETITNGVSDGYVRAQQTLEPLSKALNLPIIMKYLPLMKFNNIRDEEYAEHYREIAGDILNKFRGKVVLICWESLNIAHLAKSLGAPEDAFAKMKPWHGFIFDQVWAIHYKKNVSGKACGFDASVVDYVENFSQKLLFGDANNDCVKYFCDDRSETVKESDLKRA